MNGPGPQFSNVDQSAIDLFCYQYLQLQPRLDYPGGRLLKRADVQDELFRRICADHADSDSPPRNARFQLRTLKELARRIQASIGDEETDEYVCGSLRLHAQVWAPATLGHCWPHLDALSVNLLFADMVSFQEVSDQIMGRIGHLMSMPQVPEADEAQLKSLVTYTLSLLQPPVQIDILENRLLIAAGGTTGLRTWEAALHLGQFLCTNRNLVAGKRVLELGAGTGYLSILCAKHLGAAHVIASDGSEDVVDTLADNFCVNNIPWGYGTSSEGSISPKLLKWGHALVGTEEVEWNAGRTIDLVVGADITYDHKVIPSLVATLSELRDLYPGVEIVIAATQRNMATLDSFQAACLQNRLKAHEVDFSTDTISKNVDKSGQHHGPLSPFYPSDTPIRIFHISSHAFTIGV